jgi:hypothetical protein
MGLTLQEVAVELAKLPANRVPERADWAKLSSSWTKRIDERIAELERLRAGLTRCIGCGCLSLRDCQFANPGDRASRLGPGPRYWIGEKTHFGVGAPTRNPLWMVGTRKLIAKSRSMSGKSPMRSPKLRTVQRHF